MKTSLAPNAPWPTYEVKEKKRKVVPPKPDRARRKHIDQKFEEWLARQPQVYGVIKKTD